MKYLIIELRNQSFSFRNPEFQNFHKSYRLPPPTTIIGLAGAAMGLSPQKSQEFFDVGFELGVAGDHLGKSSDLWKYRKLKGKEFITDILTREIFFENWVYLVFGHPDIEKINTLQASFENPVYALTLGNSDGLVKVVNMETSTDAIECTDIKNCIVEGNIMEEVLANPAKYEFSLREGEDPNSYDVPVRFTYTSEYGMRKVSQRKELSFIGDGMHVNGVSKPGIRYKDVEIPLFKIYA